MTTVAEFANDIGVHNRIVECLNSYSNVYNSITVQTLAVEWLNEYTVGRITRSNRVAGRIRYHRKTIELHEELFVPGREGDLRDTFIHEVAHLIQMVILITTRNSHYSASHGRGWRWVMTRLGANPERCHQLPYLIEKSQAARAARGHNHEYTCKDCGYVYKTVRALTRPGDRYHALCVNRTNRGRLTHHDLRSRPAG